MARTLLEPVGAGGIMAAPLSDPQVLAALSTWFASPPAARPAPDHETHPFVCALCAQIACSSHSQAAGTCILYKCAMPFRMPTP
jgi:hypothetical protein